MMCVLFDDILSVCEGMGGAVAMAKPWFSQAISKPATWKRFSSAIEPSLGRATGSQAIAEPSRATATLVQNPRRWVWCVKQGIFSGGVVGLR